MDPELKMALAMGINPLSLLVQLKTDSKVRPVEAPGTWQYLWGSTWSVIVKPEELESLRGIKEIGRIRVNKD